VFTYDDESQCVDIEDEMECITCGMCEKWCTLNNKSDKTVSIKFDETTYKMNIESIGMLMCDDIFLQVLEILDQNLDLFMKDFNNFVKGVMLKLDSRITYNYNPNNPLVYEFIIDQEDHTLGYLLETYFLYHPSIMCSAYRKQHPLDEDILLKLTTKQSHNLVQMKDLFGNVVDQIKAHLHQIRIEFKNQLHK